MMFEFKNIIYMKKSLHIFSINQISKVVDLGNILILNLSEGDVTSRHTYLKIPDKTINLIIFYQIFTSWPLIYLRLQLSSSGGLACIIRGKPNIFDESSVTCKEIDQLDIELTYGPQEELVGTIIKLVPTSEKLKLQV